MTNGWSEKIGLLESPFATEAWTPTEQSPSEEAETAGLPSSWLEYEGDGRGDEVPFAESFDERSDADLAESPFATESWAPAGDWSAETAEIDMGEAEAEAAVFPASRLEWPGASAQQLTFMRAVYDEHVRRSKAAGASFTADLPAKELDVVEGSHRARTDAADAARRTLGEARAALAAAGLAGKVRIGVLSAYRPGSEQFVIWQGKGRKGGFPHYYREMLREGRLNPGDHSSKAVAAMAKEIAGWIAAPGYSNHQDGLAIDFGIGVAGKGLGLIGKRAWFHKWLVANAARFGFHPYDKEAWHWTYRGSAGSEDRRATPMGAVSAGAVPTGAVSAGAVPTGAAGVRELPVRRVPVLASHRGGGPDLILRWNVSSVPEVIDVVVHLHGYWYSRLQLARDIQPVSGLDLGPVAGATGQGRSRPTLTLLPRGDDTGIKQKNGPYNVYKFPGLVTKNGLTDLVRFSLDRFAAELGGAAPQVGRLILTAHSGGGAALLQILSHHDPRQIHQVHVFDALYQGAAALASWARWHIRQDRAAVQALGAQSAREYMTSRGGALRVFYQDRYKGGARPYSLQLRGEISSELGPELEAWYRIEASRYDHFQIPKRYGWRVLADASVDVPDAYSEPTTRREVDFEDYDLEGRDLEDLEENLVEDGDLETLAVHEPAEMEFWDEQATSTDVQQAEDPESFAASAANEALPSAFEESDLDRSRQSYEIEEAGDDEELDIAKPTYSVLSAAFEAADLVAESQLLEIEEAEDKDGVESGEVEEGEAIAFLEYLYSGEPAFAEETGSTVTFPSGATLRAVSGATGKGEEHYDPWATGNPLLDTGGSARSTLLSTSFTVGELVRSGRTNFDKARIDPELVRCLQKLRDFVGKSVTIRSGYRPYLYNKEVYEQRCRENPKKCRKPTQSRHSSGQAADVSISGMSGIEIAKAAIDLCGTEIGVGIADTYAHIDVRDKWAKWTYYGNNSEKDRRAIAEIEAHRQRRRGAGAGPAPGPSTPHEPAPSQRAAAQILDALRGGLWDTAVRIAIGTGVTDVNQLTNMLFYLRHPHLRGKRIEPEQRDLAREWTEIRNRWVKPALSAGPASGSEPSVASPTPVPAGSPIALQFTAKVPERQRFAALVPILDRHRGDIPLDFLLGWIHVESRGRIDVITRLDERGFFQVHPAESKDNRLQHERLTIDPDYSVHGGIQLVRIYINLARRRYSWIPFGSELFWRVVKLQHAMGSGLTKAVLSDMSSRGIPPTSWDAIKAYELTETAQRLHGLLRVKPGRFGRNVDTVFTHGRQIATSLGR